MELTEELIATDLLKSEKELTKAYCLAALEAACPEVKKTFILLQEKIQRHQYKLFQIMHQQGWYITTPSDKTKVKSLIRPGLQKHEVY